MNLHHIEQELEYLIKAMPENPGAIVAILSEPVKPFAERLARQFKDSTIFAQISDARELNLTAEIGNPSNVKAALSAHLDLMGDEVADAVVLRSSGYEGKERLLNLIRDSAAHLKTGGRIYLVTHKNRGARGHQAMIEEVCGNSEILNKGGGGIRILAGTRKDAPQSVSTSSQPAIEEMILGQPYIFQTHEAVFSKKRVDIGTRFLLESLPVYSAKNILDLGCGYGVIGIVLAKRFPEAHVTLSDVDLKSVDLARTNIRLNRVEDQTTVMLSDGLKQMPNAKFDLVVTHFPLHIPRAELKRILTETRGSLIGGGRLCGVALKSYDVRPTIQAVFGNVEVIAEPNSSSEQDDYRVLCARKLKATD
jgi:16S rRNA (guanine1207-N2)-methyltransferase